VEAGNVLRLESAKLDAETVEKLAAELGDAPHTHGVGYVEFTFAGERNALLDTVRAADRLGVPVRGMSLKEPTLETVFLELTGRALRD